MKKILTFLFLTFFIFQQNCIVFAQESLNPQPKESLHGQVELDKGNNQDKKIFTGETKEVHKGTNLKMTVSQVLSSGYNQQGDEFFAEVANDLTVQNGIVIPTGTIAHGSVTRVEDSKRLGRDAYINLHFDYLITPDGRQIPIEASMTTKRNPAVSVAKVALEDTGYTVAGGLIGGYLALRVLGIGAAVASHGYTLAGGAGIGAVVGATASLVRKGNEALIQPGDEINVKVGESLSLPIMSQEAFKDKELLLDGLNVIITDYKLEPDPFGEMNTITLSLDIDNKTNRTFSTFDLALVNDYKAVYYASPFGDTELWFKKIAPNSRTTGKLSFAVDNPKRKHWLIFYDTNTREPLAKISINNAKKRLAQKH